MVPYRYADADADDEVVLLVCFFGYQLNYHERTYCSNGTDDTAAEQYANATATNDGSIPFHSMQVLCCIARLLLCS